jgi:hypothetical protein
MVGWRDSCVLPSPGRVVAKAKTHATRRGKKRSLRISAVYQNAYDGDGNTETDGTLGFKYDTRSRLILAPG